MRKTKLEILKEYFNWIVKWFDDQNNFVKKPDETLKKCVRQYYEVQKMNGDLIDKVLDVFLKFCLLKHQIAFFQWRYRYRDKLGTVNVSFIFLTAI